MSAVLLSIAGDLATSDVAKSVTLIARGGGETAVTQSVRTSITTREAEASGGKYLASDAVWRFDSAGIIAAPEVGGWLRDGVSRIWTILAVEVLASGEQFRVIARKLDIPAALDTRITIQRAVWTKDAAGAPVAAWIDHRVNVLARVQSMLGEIELRHQRRDLTVTHRIFVQEPVALDSNYRILQGPRVFHVAGFEQLERIDALNVILASESPWLLAELEQGEGA